MPVPYDEKTVIYTYPDDERMDKDGENHLRISGRTNQLTWDLMKDRFVVLRNFIPKDIINLSLDTWKTIEHNGAWDEAIFKREHEITQNSPKDSLGKSKANYCTPMAVSLHRWLKEKLDNSTIKTLIPNTKIFTTPKTGRKSYIVVMLSSKQKL